MIILLIATFIIATAIGLLNKESITNTILNSIITTVLVFVIIYGFTLVIYRTTFTENELAKHRTLALQNSSMSNAAIYNGKLSYMKNVTKRPLLLRFVFTKVNTNEFKAIQVKQNDSKK